MIDFGAVAKMLFEKRAYLWFNWGMSLLFLGSFLQILSTSYENMEELWSQRSTLLILFMSFGYLLVFFAAVSVHDRFQSAMGAKRASACSNTSLVFGIIFACASVFWRILPSAASFDPLTALGLSPTAYASVGWVFSLLLGILLLRSWTKNDDKEQTEPSVPRKGRHFRAARTKTYPATYPNGWYHIAASADVPVGKVVEVQAVGKVFAVYRGENGVAAVLDAYCVHLGANMAVGGKVVGNCLECPFHKWQFNGDGKVTHIPYADKIPEVAKTQAWPTREYYGHICVYYDAEGREPPYELDPYPQIDSGQFVYRGVHRETVSMHIQEFAENAVDYMHFDPLHGRMQIPWTGIEIPWITIKHTARWELDEDPAREHVSYFLDHAVLLFRGKEMPSTQADAKITFMGPGSVVTFHFQIPELGDIIMFQTHTPTEPCRLNVQFYWYADKRIPRVLVWYVVGNWIAQWRNDIFVWENKVYKPKPVLVRGDGPVPKLRRWYSQFYSEVNRITNGESDCMAHIEW